MTQPLRSSIFGAFIVSNLVLVVGCSSGPASPGKNAALKERRPTAVGDSCGTAGGANYILTYSSALSRWCVDEGVYAAHAADFNRFYSYGDTVITTLQN